jgi:alpha-1,2-mannosyltransferase
MLLRNQRYEHTRAPAPGGDGQDPADQGHEPAHATGDISRRLRWAGWTALATALLLYLVEYLRWPDYLRQIDVLVYRFGAQRVLDGHDLYSVGILGNSRDLLFTYSPFAALCFIPLALLGKLTVQIASLAASLVLLTYAVHRMGKSAGASRARGSWSLTALLVGLIGWLEPVRFSVQLGQINLAILAVVVGEVLAPKERKWAGAALGVVAGIKLTPAIFIIYLAMIGQRRAALVATAALVGTIGAGFLLLPTDSKYYWLGRHFDDPRRINHDPAVSFNVSGLFLRLHYPTALGTTVAIALAITGLALAAAAHRRGHAVLGIALAGMAASTASPFSWSHHWVWLAPLVVHFGHRAYVCRSAPSTFAMWSLWAVCAAWPVTLQGTAPEPGLIKLRPGGIWNDVVPAGYVLVYLVVCTCTAAWLWPFARSRAAPAGAQPAAWRCTRTVSRPPSRHGLGPLDMPVEAKRCRHGAVALHEVRGGLAAAGPRQEGT